MVSTGEGGGQRCITSTVRNQNKKVTLARRQCCMQNTQTQRRLGPFDALGPQRNKTGSKRSVSHLPGTAFISLTRSSTSGVGGVQTASESVPLQPVHNERRAQETQTCTRQRAGECSRQAAESSPKSHQ